MKLTYTLTFDVERSGGPNVKKDRVSAALIDALLEHLGPDGDPSIVIAGTRRDEYTWIEVRDLAIWSHDDSLPNAADMAARERVDVPADLNDRAGRALAKDPVRA